MKSAKKNINYEIKHQDGKVLVYKDNELVKTFRNEMIAIGYINTPDLR
ncbi:MULTISPECIES: hypothetical protein [Flammeovirga]|uniref:Uncharacterized protein n=1 Tax=Flammeovirga agarivorans TaxID=2726742 RepID=A0A7X8XVY8_9BACT|nr:MULTISPECIES: hypothetical protein [Flammeovirga]NLR91787.1 hypothetical protein [Flammeovirga agarivorans]